MYYNYEKLKKLPITQVIGDFGIKHISKSTNSVLILCPNPNHADRKMGNCVATYDRKVNAFNCFSCGTKGSVIDLVAYTRGCNTKNAAKILSEHYGVEAEAPDKTKKQPEPMLTIDEWKVLGLNEVVHLNSPGEGSMNSKIYTLAEFAKDDPEGYEEMILNKVLHRLVWIDHYFKGEEAEYLRKEKGSKNVSTIKEILTELVWDTAVKALTSNTKNNNIRRAL